VRTLKIVPSSCPGEGRSCSSESKHDRRKASRAKLFVAERILQEQWSQSRQTALGLIPDEVVFCSSNTDEDRRTAHRTKLFVVARILQKLRS
jgi:hypothetical protein